MSEEKIDELIAVMREILKYQKFAGAKEVRNVLTAALDSDQKRLIYHLSDGNRGSVEIAKTANIGDSTVRRYWESWARQGIMEAIKVRGGDRYKKSFELEDFGMTVPQTQGGQQ
ncbi:MAG: hypothetical protein ACFCUE_10965 [Candidatus Bathyarchaeia archaeon]|jgi:hypothetical protein